MRSGFFLTCALWCIAIFAHAESGDAYDGVVPGKNADPSHLLGKPGTRPARVTWPGFQMLPDGRSEVFIQTTVPVTYALLRKGKRIELRLVDTKLPGRNNKRRLITKYFQTPVLETRLKKHGRDVIAISMLRDAVDPVVSAETAKTGYYFIHLTFPPQPQAADRSLPSRALETTGGPTRSSDKSSSAKAKRTGPQASSPRFPRRPYKPELDRESPPH